MEFSKKEQLDYIKQLLFLVNKYPMIIKKGGGFCYFLANRFAKGYITKTTYFNIEKILLLPTIDPRINNNNFGIKYSLTKSKNNLSGYFFKPRNIWRRKLWLKRLIKKLKKDVK